MTPWYTRTGVGARPAFGFPWLGHRTCAEIRTERNPGGLMIDRRVGLSVDQGRIGLKLRASLPDTSCPRCEARAWCEHRKDAA